MNQINRTNIRQFIAQLYRERKGGEAPAALLDSWVNLSDEEIEKNLVGLFESWGMGTQERSTAIERFVRNQVKPQTAAAYNNEFEDYKDTIPNATPKKKNNVVLWIFLILIIGAAAYIGYQYVQYAALSRVYAITENIAIRDIDGKSIGRMDLYEKDKTVGNSFSSLRAMDNEVYFKQPEGSDKEYPTRMVMMDSVGFIDFLFKKEQIASFVNVNYIVNDKAEYELYQSAFKEIAEVPSDNSKLNVVYRKVIVGSMAKTKGTKEKYLSTNKGNLPNNTLKNTESILVFEKKKGSEYIVVASLNDGNFYQFEGDINTNTFQPLQLINQYDANNVASNLSGSYRFIKQGDKWKLYDVADRNTTLYALEIRNDGADYDFVYTAPVVIDTITTDTTTTAPVAQ